MSPTQHYWLATIRTVDQDSAVTHTQFFLRTNSKKLNKFTIESLLHRDDGLTPLLTGMIYLGEFTEEMFEKQETLED